MLCPCTSPMTAGGSSVAESDQIVEVAADVDAAGGRQIAGCYGEVANGGQRHREKGLLQTVGEVVLGVVQESPVHGLCDEPAQGHEDCAVARAEDVRMVVGQDTAADTAVGDHQGQECPGVLFAEHGGTRVGAGHLGGVGEKGRDTATQGLTGGCEVRVQGQAIQACDAAWVVASVPDDPEATGIGGGDDHALRSESGQNLVGHHVDHVGHGDGLAQSGRQVDQLVDSPRARCLR